jgi:hypothetical protein
LKPDPVERPQAGDDRLRFDPRGGPVERSKNGFIRGVQFQDGPVDPGDGRGWKSGDPGEFGVQGGLTVSRKGQECRGLVQLWNGARDAARFS